MKKLIILFFLTANLSGWTQSFSDGTEFYCANYSDLGSCAATENDVAELTSGDNIASAVYNSTEKALEITSKSSIDNDGAAPSFFAWYYH